MSSYGSPSAWRYSTAPIAVGFVVVAVDVLRLTADGARGGSTEVAILGVGLLGQSCGSAQWPRGPPVAGLAPVVAGNTDLAIESVTTEES